MTCNLVNDCDNRSLRQIGRVRFQECEYRVLQGLCHGCSHQHQPASVQADSLLKQGKPQILMNAWATLSVASLLLACPSLVELEHNLTTTGVKIDLQ